MITRQFRDIPPGWLHASFDFRIARPDGTIRYVHDEAEFTRDTTGEVIKMFGTIQDVTERKLAEEALKVSEERFFNVTNSTLDAIVSMNESATVIFWNKAAERIFGYSKYEAIGKPVWMILPPEFHASFARSMDAYNSSGNSLPRDAIMQYDGLRKDGSTFPIEISLSGWKEKNLSFFTAIVRDITERKRAEEVVRKSEEQYRHFTGDARDALTIIEGDHVKFASPETLEILGVNEHELAHDTHIKLAAPEEQERLASGRRRTQGQRQR